MNDDLALIDKTKELIMSDCVDTIFVSKREIINYLKKNKTGYLPFFNGCNSKLSINNAVTRAIDELAKDGKVIKSGEEIRKPYKF